MTGFELLLLLAFGVLLLLGAQADSAHWEREHNELKEMEGQQRRKTDGAK